MADRHRALRSLARQLAAERVDAPVARPRFARVPLPDEHLVDVAGSRTYRLRLTAPGIDVNRFGAALIAAARRHDALRLGVTRDSGRCFLVELADPVARVDSVDELERADPDHPLRWAVSGSTVTLAVSAFLVDRSCWPTMLSTVEAAYRGAALPPPALDYGDYCYWLAHRDGDEPAPSGPLTAEPYLAFACGQPWAVQSRSWTLSASVDDLASRLANALRACGWQSTDIGVRRSRPRSPATPIVGRVDEPVVGPADVAIVADVAVIDRLEARFDGEPAIVEPVLEAAPGWQCLLVGDRLHLAGPESTLPALLGALDGTPFDGAAIAAARTEVELRAPRIVTAQRTLSADVVAGAVRRRAEELRAAGVLPGSPVVIESTEGPETVANLLAALRCRADVLPLDPADPPAWRAGLVAQLPGAVVITADNVVHPAEAPSAGGEGALLVGLSSAPARPVLARIPLPELKQGAAALRGGGAGVVNPARAGEDLALKVLAGTELVLVGGDGAEAIELLAQVPGCAVDVHLVEDWSVPLHQVTGARWTRRAADAVPDTVTSWWVAEAPGAQWLATDDGLRLRSGSARVVDHDGRSMPDGTVGELAVAVPAGCRYVGDPRRTAERFRPAPDGGRELWTGTLAGKLADGIQVLRFAPDRAVDRNRTCLTDAWRTLVPEGFIGPQPVGSPAAEGMFVVSTGPVEATDLPGPLAAALIHVDPAAAELDLDRAWHSVQTRTEHPETGDDDVWATPEEVILAKEVVERVLGVPVRRNDDLFYLGATSMQLMRVLLQVKERVGVEVPLARFFATPTVAVLAELIREPADPSAAALDLLEEIAGES